MFSLLDWLIDSAPLLQKPEASQPSTVQITEQPRKLRSQSGLSGLTLAGVRAFVSSLWSSLTAPISRLFARV